MESSQTSITSRTSQVLLLVNYAFSLTSVAYLLVYTITIKNDLASTILANKNIENRVTELERKCKVINLPNDVVRKDIEGGIDSLMQAIFYNTRRKRSINRYPDEPSPMTMLPKVLNISLIIPNKVYGPPGPMGPPGPVGPIGLRGRRGKAGPRGYKGIKGDRGKQGPLGMKGSKGDQGPIGIKGEKGAKGGRGQKGDTVARPFIVIPPQNKTVVENQTVTFFCDATGNPVPEIQLMLNNKSSEERYKNIGKGMLQIEKVKFKDRGKVVCKATSPLGEDLQISQLIVLVPPRAIITSRQIDVEESYKVELECKVEGNPWPIIKWHRNSSKMLPNTATFKNKMQVIQMSNVKLEDSGDYICEAENYLANSKSIVSVNVKKRLSFSFRSSNSIILHQSTNFSISCFYQNGVSPIKVSWLKDGSPIDSNASISLSKGNQILSITGVKMDHAGRYTCIVQSRYSLLRHTVRMTLDFAHSCQHLRKLGVDKSGIYFIKPSIASLKASQVYCDMESNGGVGVTMVSHDSESRMSVDGFEGVGSYRRVIKYSMQADQIKELIAISNSCSQYIKYECTGSVLYLHTDVFGWWVSSKGQKMTNWGGTKHGHKGCTCSLTGSCVTGTCMCDANDSTPREDSGYLNEKEHLPISEVRFGDTGDNSEIGYHTIGKLACY